MVYTSTHKSKYMRSRYRTPQSERGIHIKYPFRLVAFLLSLGIIMELIALVRLPDYKDDVEKARHDYLVAQAENIQLTKELDLAQQQNTVEQSARKQGMAYYGETIYIPVIENNEAGDSQDP